MEHDEKHYFNFTLTVYGDFNTIAQYGKEYSDYVKFRPPVHKKSACRMILHGGSWSAEAKMWILRSDILVGGDWNAGTWLDYDFPYIYIGNGIIIPTDFHIFQRGRYTTNQYWFYNVFTVHVSVCSWSNWCGFFVRIQGRQPNQPTNRGLFGIRRRIVPPSCKFVYKPHELNVVISCYIYHKYP